MNNLLQIGTDLIYMAPPNKLLFVEILPSIFQDRGPYIITAPDKPIYENTKLHLKPYSHLQAAKLKCLLKPELHITHKKIANECPLKWQKA